MGLKILFGFGVPDEPMTGQVPSRLHYAPAIRKLHR